MTVTIELTAEEEQQLRAQADRQGQDVGAAVTGLVRAGLGVAELPGLPEEEAAFARHLLKTGLINELPVGYPGPPPPPVTVQGPPLSETLLEDRR